MKELVSVRGAITVENDRASIVAAMKRLIDRIYFKNELTDADVVSVIITVTKDITAYSPARAVRDAGRRVPLLACVEPEVDGSLPQCVRVMVNARSEHAPKHVYLNGARALRPDIAGTFAVALDGPSGAGKSTVAKAVAKKLGITYLDTGALYRALGVTCLDSGVNTKDASAVESCIKDVGVDIKYVDGVQRVYAQTRDVSDVIRTPAVSMAASDVSAHPYVRKKLLGLQRDIAAKSSVILDGRDIGTVVLPDAEFKFFLTASAEVRAKRRYDELVAKGQSVVYEDIYNDVVMRDHNDSTRAVAPLKRAYDAVEINSDSMTADQVVECVMSYITEDIAQ